MLIACIRVRPALSNLVTPSRHPLLTAHKATLAAAPGNPRHNVQHVWATFYPHLSAHFLSLSSHPEVDLHFLY